MELTGKQTLFYTSISKLLDIYSYCCMKANFQLEYIEYKFVFLIPAKFTNSLKRNNRISLHKMYVSTIYLFQIKAICFQSKAVALPQNKQIVLAYVLCKLIDFQAYSDAFVQSTHRTLGNPWTSRYEMLMRDFLMQSK